MHAHLHVLLPSSTPGVRLEARVYVPPDAAASALAPQLSMDGDSEPIDIERVDRAALSQLRIDTLVTVAHPWARLGGNMLFPLDAIGLHLIAGLALAVLRRAHSAPGADGRVIAHHLPLGVYDSGVRAAIATFNVRGVGRSEGSQPWPGWGIGSDGDDYAAVEGAVLALLVGGTGDKPVSVTGETNVAATSAPVTAALGNKSADGRDIALFRLGYSYGTLLAVNAPPREGLRRTMLIAPAPTLFRAMTMMRGPTFQQGWDGVVSRAAEACAAATDAGKIPDTRAVWVVYGTSDDFTSASTLRALTAGRAGVVPVEIEGCGHFFTRGEDGRTLRAAIADWVSGR